MTLFVRVAFAAIVLAITPAAASTPAGQPEVSPVAKSTLLQVAQGMTPEGWRVEGPPRYKKASPKSKMNEPTKFREEPMRYKKSGKGDKGATTGTGN